MAITRVLMDDRERGCAAAESLSSLVGVSAEFTRLKVGDYLVDDRLIVERKSLSDFAASVEDGRLFRQAERMASSGCMSVLILEGQSGDFAASHFRREALQGALITVSLLYRIPVLRAMDGAETARLILFAARQLQRAATGSVFRTGRRPRGKKAAQLRILQGLPGIGPKRAERLLLHFGTVQAAFQADADELQGLDGIGKRTAGRILWAVRETPEAYK